MYVFLLEIKNQRFLRYTWFHVFPLSSDVILLKLHLKLNLYHVVKIT